MGVAQVSPHYGLFTKRLQDLFVNEGSTRVELVTYLFKFRLIISGTYPKPLDANAYAGTKRSSVCITEPAIRNRYPACERKGSRHLVGCRESDPKAAYLPQHSEALSERLARTIKLAKDLWVQ